MPLEELNRRQLFQLALLVLVVPLQFWLTSNSGSSESNRLYEINRVLNRLSNFSTNYLQSNPWLKWCGYVLDGVKLLYPFGMGSEDGENDLASAKVVENATKHLNGSFASSKEPRSPRNPKVEFRVGQVVSHKKWKYRGVIVGWDEVAKGPNKFFEAMHPKEKPKMFSIFQEFNVANPKILEGRGGKWQKTDCDRPSFQMKEWRELPNYAVLVDTRDRLIPQMAYVVEENLIALSNTRVFHPLITHFFENFDGSQYLMRPWMRMVYPHD